MRFRTQHWLTLLLVVAAALRFALVWQGGQGYFGDEGRYRHGVEIHQALLHGDRAALAAALRWPEHVAFNYLNAIVATVHHACAQFTDAGDWTRAGQWQRTARIAAAVLSLGSVLCLWLVHRVARLAGASEGEACWAALLLAACTSFFYFSRHLLPYDWAIAAALGSLACGLQRRAFAAGALAALTFELYNGYWFLVPVLGLGLGLSLPDWTERRRALPRWLAGAAAAVALVLLPGTLADARGFWTLLLEFSGTVLQGDFAEGWSLPLEYFWHAEGWIALLLLAGMLGAAAALRRDPAAAPRLRLWLALPVAGYLLLVLFSVGLEKFVVYGRTARPLVPWACLATAYGLHRVLRERRPLALGAVAVLGAGGLAHFAPHYFFVFPREVERLVLEQSGNPKRALTFSGSIYLPLRTGPDAHHLLLVNALPLYPVRTYLGESTAGRVVFSFPHPLDYPPYQYEGHTRRQRELLRAHPPQIQLRELPASNSLPVDPPRRDLFTDADRPDGHERIRPPHAPDR